MIVKIWDEIKSLVSLRSLRARIFILILVVGMIPSVLMRYGILDNYEKRAVEHRISTVQNQLMIVGNHLLSNNYFSAQNQEERKLGTSRDVINAELEMISNLYEGRVMVINSGLKVMKDTYGISEGKTIISEEVIKCFRGESISHYDSTHGYIEMTTPVVSKPANSEEQPVIVGVMLTSISNDAIVATMEILNRKAQILEILIIAAGYRIYCLIRIRHCI